MHGTATQLNGHSTLESFDEPVALDEDTHDVITLGEVCTSQSEDPSVEAARNLDWQTFIQSQDERSQAILKFMAEGRKLTELARTYGLSSSTIFQHKKRLASAVVEFMGPDIIQVINRRPAWTDNLHATKEKMACKSERR